MAYSGARGTLIYEKNRSKIRLPLTLYDTTKKNVCASFQAYCNSF